MKITFTRPIAHHQTWIVWGDGNIIGKVRRITQHRCCLAEVRELALGGTHGAPGVKAFPTLKDAKTAIIKAAA